MRRWDKRLRTTKKNKLIVRTAIETATAENVEQPHEEDQSQFLSSSISSLFNTDLNVCVCVCGQTLFVCVYMKVIGELGTASVCVFQWSLPKGKDFDTMRCYMHGS